MRKSLAYFILLSITQLLSGCGLLGDEDDLRFTTDDDLYQTGEIVTLLLENRSVDRIGVNLCVAYLELEQLDDEQWSESEAVLEGPGGSNICLDVLPILGPMQSVKEDVLLSSKIQSGTYRINTDVEVIGGKSRVVRTNEFRVSE